MASSLPESIEDVTVEQLTDMLAEAQLDYDKQLKLSQELSGKADLVKRISETREKTKNLKAESDTVRSLCQPESPNSSSDGNVSDLLCLLRLMRGTKVKSGKALKASNYVLKQVKWAHQGLKFNFCPELLANEPTVDELPFPLLIAGEIGVIMSLFNLDKAPKEVVFRLKLLEKMAYWYERLGDCEAITAFYSAALRNIECGLATWSTPTDELETSLLALAHPKPPVHANEGDSWVSDYDGDYSFNSSNSPTACAVEDEDRLLSEATKL